MSIVFRPKPMLMQIDPGSALCSKFVHKETALIGSLVIYIYHISSIVFNVIQPLEISL